MESIVLVFELLNQSVWRFGAEEKVKMPITVSGRGSLINVVVFQVFRKSVLSRIGRTSDLKQDLYRKDSLSKDRKSEGDVRVGKSVLVLGRFWYQYHVSKKRGVYLG